MHKFKPSYLQQSTACSYFAWLTTSLRVGGWTASCLPGLCRGGRQAGATVLSCLVWRCELSLPYRPTNAFCVGVRPAVALHRPTHSDTDLTQNPPVRRSGRLNSHRHARHDKTVLSVSCLAWRCELSLISACTRLSYLY